MPLFTREGSDIHLTVRNFYTLVAMIAVVGFGGGFAFAKGNLQDRATESSSRTGREAGEEGTSRGNSVQDRLVANARNIIGSADAPVTIVEFTDYDCPYCRRYYSETFPKIMERFGDRVRYVMRHFPLVSMHPEAVKAAEANGAVGEVKLTVTDDYRRNAGALARQGAVIAGVRLGELLKQAISE